MIEIKKLTSFNFGEFLSFGELAYTSDAKFEITKRSNENETSFNIKYTKQDLPYSKKFKNNRAAHETYQKIISDGVSFGAYNENELIGFLIGEKREWNNSLWIEMIFIKENLRIRGIGSSLLNSFEKYGQVNKFRAVQIETQNTNVPAVYFYKKNGYEIDGLHLSLYDPEEMNDEIAIYMSKKI